MSSIRKSTRTRTLTVKAKTNTKPAVSTKQPPPQQQSKRSNQDDQHVTKKRKISKQMEQEEQQEQSDKIDPVEKLLSLTSTNNDFLSDLESSSEGEEEELEYIREIASVNFTKILQDNIRNYYSRKLRMNQYKDTFSLLNSQESQQQTDAIQSNTEASSKSIPSRKDEVPFFKNVNFGRSKEYTIDDFFAYNDEDEEEKQEDAKSPTDEASSPTTATPSLYIPKINQRFNYRQNHLNFASDYPSATSNMSTGMSPSDSQDIFKILNKRCILTGKASEMVSTGNFLINDFFL